MAGRKPRESRDEQSGVTPLHGPRPPVRPGGHRNPGSGRMSGIQPDGTWVPAHAGQRPPFRPGNEAALTHGATSQRAVELAQRLVFSVLEDPAMPGHLRSPAFRHSLEAWARLQTMADMIFPWMADLEIEEMTAPQGRIGNGKSRLELYLMAESKAAVARARLGLDPVSYAKIKKDLGIAQNASESALEKLAKAGAALVAARAEITAGLDVT